MMRSMIFILLLISFIWAENTIEPHQMLFDHDQYTGWSADLRYMGLSFHPGGGNDTKGSQYPRALDSAAYFVLQVGAEAEVDYNWNSWLSFRGVTNLYQDCIEVWAGTFSFGPVIGVHLPRDFNLRIGIGPTEIWRQSWFKNSAVNSWYHGDGFYGHANTGSDYQTAFLWYGGNVDLSWKFNSKWGIIYSVIPGYPQVIVNSLGLRHWF